MTYLLVKKRRKKKYKTFHYDLFKSTAVKLRSVHNYLLLNFIYVTHALARTFGINTRIWHYLAVNGTRVINLLH